MQAEKAMIPHYIVFDLFLHSSPVPLLDILNVGSSEGGVKKRIMVDHCLLRLYCLAA
jgi:hypothetical protein